MTATISYGSFMTVQAMYHDIKLGEEIGDRPFVLICVPNNGIHGVLGFETAEEARNAVAAQAAGMIANGLNAPIIREITLAGTLPLANANVGDPPVSEARREAFSRLDRFRNIVTYALGIKQKQLA